MPSTSAIYQHDRQYDLVVFGATGYTGAYTAGCVAADLPTDLCWAIAGRSEGKLKKLATELKAKHPDRRQPDIQVCSLDDGELAALAKKTFLLLATVGPYALYGEHAFKACAENGTHYLDVTGEVPWTAAMINKYEAVAKRTGAIMIPQIGIESAPSDLFAFTLSKAIRDDLHVPTRDVRLSVDLINVTASGGTLATIFNMLDVFGIRAIAQALKPYAISPVPNPNAPSDAMSLSAKLTGLQSFPHIGMVTTSLMGRTNAAIAERTWGLQQTDPALKKYFYGPNFSFTEYTKARSRLHGAAMHLALGVGFGFLALLPPLRKLVRKFLPYQPGEGPTPEEAERQTVEFRAIARPDLPPGSSDKIAYSEATFRGGMYYLTGILLAQGAQTILKEYDHLQLKGGIYTPACLGQSFVDHLAEGGFRIETRIIKA